MTILKDGEKFACKQCIQGHRVSTCHHEERPLIHVARKGRPVSQCMHCRGLRKARSTHIKCDCGERRHSRTTSSESATLAASDHGTCRCSTGKKCTCALKKDSKSDLPSSLAISFYADRRNSKLPVPNRRTHSTLPTPQTANSISSRSNMSGQKPLQQSQFLQSDTGRGHHGPQRSVDSLPLFHFGHPVLPSNARQSNQYLAPNSSMSPRSQSDTLLSVNENSRHFNVPIDQDVMARTLSPQNPKRYSMNDWSMMSFNANDLSSFGPAGQNPSGFSYAPSQALDTDMWSNASITQTPPTYPAAMFQEPNYGSRPQLSSSSTGTISDMSEYAWQTEGGSFSATAMQPIITLNPSPYQPELDGKNNLSWTPASYHNTLPDYSFPAQQSSPRFDQSHNLETYPESPNYRELQNFAGLQDFQGQGMPMLDASYPGLVDRSVPQYAITSPDMNAAFRFPANDFSLSQPYSENNDQKDWLADDSQYLEFIDTASPMAH